MLQPSALNKMATCWNPTVLCINNSTPKISTTNTTMSSKLQDSFLTLKKSETGRKRWSTVLQAGLAEIEPDLNEDPVDRWENSGIDSEDFVFGEYDGHHTYFETSEKGTFWGAIAEEYAAMDPPTGFQGVISWLFLPVIFAGMYFDVPGDYLFIGAGLFVIVFCTMEMLKPDQPHNFEPQIYNMERGQRDKLISDYNTMDIWDFNEKYGELWDFTVQHDDIRKW